MPCHTPGRAQLHCALTLGSVALAVYRKPGRRVPGGMVRRGAVVVRITVGGAAQVEASRGGRVFTHADADAAALPPPPPPPPPPQPGALRVAMPVRFHVIITMLPALLEGVGKR